MSCWFPGSSVTVNNKFQKSPENPGDFFIPISNFLAALQSRIAKIV